MEVREIIIPYRRGEIFKGYPLGDCHIGTKYCTEDKLKAKVREIEKDPYSFWWDMGDKCEFISPSDIRWEQKAIADWVEDYDDIGNEQVSYYCDIVRPIVKAKIKGTNISKCIGAIEGNHEWVIKKRSHINVQKRICKELGISNLGYTCIYHIIFRRDNSNESHMFKGVFTHGSGNAQTRGGKLNKLRKFMNQFEADFFAYGHMHDIITEVKPTLRTNKNLELKEFEAQGVVSGCWFRTYTQGVEPSYGEMRNYDPTTIGCPVFCFNPDKQEIIASKGTKKKGGE